MDWWPDWSGQTVVIGASGPSLTRADLDLCRDKARVVTINETWREAPWADIAYGCDWQWWARRGPTADEVSGLRIIGALPSDGEKSAWLTPEQRAGLAELLRVSILTGTGPMIFEGHQIRGGGNSAFQAVNLVARWGVRRIILLGVDCDGRNSHHHPPHTFKGAPQQSDDTIDDWLKGWKIAAPQLARRGIEVINCSPISMVRSFPRRPLADVL